MVFPMHTPINNVNSENCCSKKYLKREKAGPWFYFGISAKKDNQISWKVLKKCLM
jgi:hypothetical protein